MRELREPGAELWCGVLARHDEQVVKCSDGSLGLPLREPLIESVKQISSRRDLIEQHTAAAVSGSVLCQSSKDAVRAVHPLETLLRLRSRETIQDLAGVHTDTGELSANTIGGVERDGQASL